MLFLEDKYGNKGQYAGNRLRSVFGQPTLAGLQKGHHPAFDLIFERHVRLLYHYGRKFTSDASIVEDIA